ncbi:hypothetical protein COLO4_03463 [Corchorus olitorius]|uniref:Uncharacterized protein n=1 Tax=Corchorus olitorius TaxID=93759 RepID=A0A1R3KYE8_9ROSI|nr:hypothetical protein COLO4_03463 [Corchorus olitorius]
MMKNAQRLISLALNSIFIIAIVVILFQLTDQVGASRPLKHPLSPTSIKTLKVSQAYSGPSRSGTGHNTVY